MARNPNRDPRLVEAQRIWQLKKREERRAKVAYQEALASEIARIEEAGEASGLEAWRIAGDRLGPERGEWQYWMGQVETAREEWRDLVWDVVREKQRQWAAEGKTIADVLRDEGADEDRGLSL